ncbi:hypothetical protein LEMLEM_LOCUS10566 [Lemmus lemmus]
MGLPSRQASANTHWGEALQLPQV